MARNRKKKNILLSPIIIICFLILIVSCLSAILSFLNVEGSQTSIVNNTLETSIVVVKNIFSKEGLIHFFTNISDHDLHKPIIFTILALATMGIGVSSGLFKHLFRPLKRLKSNFLTFIVLLLSIILTFIGDYSYFILIPLSAVAYKYMGKSPILGIITVFLGITLGSGAGILCDYNSYALGLFTEGAALNVDATYKYTSYSNLYIILFLTIFLSIFLTSLIEKYLVKKLTIKENQEDELVTSNKALLFSIITFIILLIPVIIMALPNGVLLDTTQKNYLAQLFGENSGFNLSFMYILLFNSSISGYVYGKLSSNYKNNHDFSFGLTSEFKNIGYLFILIILSSILIGIINWTNIGVVFATKLLDLLNLLDLAGIPLIVVSFILIVLMSVIMPVGLEKWALISPVLVPLFMKGNLTPDFAQVLFELADGVGKSLTPSFVYLLLLVGFIERYNINENKITLYGIIKLMLPIVAVIAIFLILILSIWYIAGLPLGIGTLATM